VAALATAQARKTKPENAPKRKGKRHTFTELVVKKLVPLHAQVHNLLAIRQPFGHLLEDFVADGSSNLVPDANSALS
jgi:hypothetical protein